MIEGNLSNWGRGSLITCNASLSSIVIATKKNITVSELMREEKHCKTFNFIHFNLFQHILIVKSDNNQQ